MKYILLCREPSLPLSARRFFHLIRLHYYACSNRISESVLRASIVDPFNTQKNSGSLHEWDLIE